MNERETKCLINKKPAVMKNLVHFENKTSSAKDGGNINLLSNGEGSEGCYKAPVLPTVHMTLGKSFHLSEPQFSYLKGTMIPALLTS